MTMMTDMTVLVTVRNSAYMQDFFSRSDPGEDSCLLGSEALSVGVWIPMF